MSAAPRDRRLRVLVVDDSAYNRQTIAGMLEASPEVEVVGRASNGQEALRDALLLRPDVITLDLEMPRMDGFTFLRLLMSRLPTPVVVVSSHSQQQNVFRALELGALDFVAKPGVGATAELIAIQAELLDKINLVRALRPAAPRPAAPPPQPVESGPKAAPGAPPLGLVVLGASTGGPPALQAVLRDLPADVPLAFLVAQHMPPGFTRAFAERLHRAVALRVKEASDGDPVDAGQVLVAPGGHHLSVRLEAGVLRAVVRPVSPDSRALYVPSIDALFLSAAACARERTLAILMTGMGADGREGIIQVRAAGGRTLAESEETAVIFGMPREAIDTGAVDRIRRLDELASEIRAFADELARRQTDGTRQKH